MLFGNHVDHATNIISPAYICLRCSKALEIAYHFMNMTLERRKELEERLQTSSGIIEVFEEEEEDDEVTYTETKIVSRVEVKELGSLEEMENGHEEEFAYEQDMETVLNDPADLEYDNKNESEQQEDITDLTIQKVAEPQVIRSYNCCYCLETFECHEFLIEHTQSIHKKMIPFKCQMCRYYTCFMESLRKHYKAYHKLDDLENRLYKTKELLAISAELEPPQEMTFRCAECEYQTHSPTEIDNHLAMEHDLYEDAKEKYTITYYNCPLCYRHFYDKTSLKIHISTTHNSQPVQNVMEHKCDKCGKCFLRKSGLVLHERYCDLAEPSQCNFCSLKFSSVLKYEQHLKAEHGVAIKYECEICHKTFKTAAYLSVHRRRHNERYYHCNMCPNTYINNAELKVHLQRNHAPKNAKICSLCKKSFGQIFQLREHLKIEHKRHHESYKCKFCNYTSNSKFALEVHQYRHTGKPYRCKFCTKQYVLRKDLKMHCRKIHDYELKDEELASMFFDKHGYTSRVDAFSKQNNNLEIDVINEKDLAMELKEFNLTFDDIIEDLFNCK
uniref:C2H2-type domain-containing protein n=1 Tax=Stomoxys calcitrans TaxID=35570 RepID=A0A1I8NTQ5_STOCA